jgi:hypothetical protein
LVSKGRVRSAAEDRAEGVGTVVSSSHHFAFLVSEGPVPLTDFFDHGAEHGGRRFPILRLDLLVSKVTDGPEIRSDRSAVAVVVRSVALHVVKCLLHVPADGGRVDRRRLVRNDVHQRLQAGMAADHFVDDANQL